MIWTNAYFYDNIKKEYISDIPLSVNFGTNTNDNDVPLEPETYSIFAVGNENTLFGKPYPVWYWGEYEFRNITYALYQQNYMDYLGKYPIEAVGGAASGVLPIEIHSYYIPDYEPTEYYENFFKLYMMWVSVVPIGGADRFYIRGNFEIYPPNPDVDKRIINISYRILSYGNGEYTENNAVYVPNSGDFFEQIGFIAPKTFFANQISEIEQIPNSTTMGSAIVPPAFDITADEFGRVKAIERAWLDTIDKESLSVFTEILKNQEPIDRPEFPGLPQVPVTPGGSYEDFHDNIEYPDIPTITSSTSGFITLYSPTIQQIKNFAGYMWNGMSNAGDLFNALNKMVANPIEMVLGLSILPFPIETIGEREIKVGLIGTGIMMNLASSQYKVVDCGSLQMYPYFGSALDYSPYTKVSIYLPYIGVRSLNIDEVQGKTLEVRYHIDILTGALSAMIKVDGSVMYTFGGMCAQMIPITSTNWATMLGTIATLVAVPLTAGMAGSIAGAMGASAAASAGASAATASATTQAAKSAATIASVSSSTADILGQAGALATSIAKPSVQRSGSVTSSSAFMDVQYPYIILERPRQSLPKDYNKFVGYPANYTAEIATLSGFTRVDSVKLVINGATNNELLEIKNLLETGVII